MEQTQILCLAVTGACPVSVPRELHGASCELGNRQMVKTVCQSARLIIRNQSRENHICRRDITM